MTAIAILCLFIGFLFVVNLVISMGSWLFRCAALLFFGLLPPAGYFYTLQGSNGVAHEGVGITYFALMFVCFFPLIILTKKCLEDLAEKLFRQQLLIIASIFASYAGWLGPISAF